MLCGGFGTRIKTLTKGKPKILVSILKKPFFYYQLKKFKSNGIKNIYLLTQYKSKQIQDFVKNVKYFNFFLYKDGEKNLGTGGSIKKNLKQLPDYFFLTYGDSYLDVKYSKLKNKLLETGSSVMTIYKNHQKFKNNIKIKNKKILKYNKNKNFNYIDYGLFLFKKESLKKIKIKNQKFDLGKYLTYLIKKNNLSYVISKKKFNECGSPEGIKKIEKIVKN